MIKFEVKLEFYIEERFEEKSKLLNLTLLHVTGIHPEKIVPFEIAYHKNLLCSLQINTALEIGFGSYMVSVRIR